MEHLSFDEAKSIVEKHFLPYKCVCSSEDHENSITLKIFYDSWNQDDFYHIGAYIPYRSMESLAWYLQTTKMGFEQELHDRNKSSH